MPSTHSESSRSRWRAHSADAGLHAHGAAAARPTHASLVLALILLAGLLIRLWLVPVHWVNADEGAHLMDGRLVLDGLVPDRDFDGRQLFYVYLTAFAVKITGGFPAVRVLPALAAVATGWLVFLLGRRLFDARVGLAACALMLLTPFTVVLTTHAKTGPWAMLLATAAVYLFVRGRESARRAAWLAGAGALLALAFYVRQSTLGVLAGLLLATLLLHGRELRRLVADYVAIGTGFTGVCIVAMGLYATVAPVRDVLASDLNPVGFVAGHIGSSLADEEAIAAAAADESGMRSARDQSPADTLWNVTESVRLNAGLVAAAVLAPLLLVSGAAPRRSLRSLAPIAAWLVMLSAAYAYYAVERGFFFAYFLEFVPPLSILAGVTAIVALERFGQPLRYAGIVGAALVLFYIAELLLPLPELHRPFYFVVPAVLLGICLLQRRGPLGNWVAAVTFIAAATALVVIAGAFVSIPLKALLYFGLVPLVFAVLFRAAALSPRTRTAVAFIALCVAVSAMVESLRFSAERVAVSYDGTWPVGVVQRVSDHLRRHSEPGDEVLSGAVVWEFGADLHPFMRVSHPLGYRPGIPVEDRRSIEAYLATDPPAHIVVDGVTEQVYLRHLPALRALLNRAYRLELTVEGGRHPVRVYTHAARSPATDED